MCLHLLSLSGNADRHHYETIKSYGDAGMLLLLDNAKRLELYCGIPNVGTVSAVWLAKPCCMACQAMLQALYPRVACYIMLY